MQIFDHLIIGGGIAGTVAAETIRQRDAEATIAIVGAEPHRLYSRVMLPHVLRGKSTEDKVFLRPEHALEDKKITVLPGVRVMRVDTSERRVTLSTGEELGYDKALLIATGGDPRRLACPGAEEAEPMYFQTLDDTRRIAATTARRAVVYGGGFIALELHMSFAHMGIPSVGVIRGEGFFARALDPRGQARIADEFARRGIEIRTGTEITAVETREGTKRVFLSKGGELDCDALGVGIGLAPNAEFLAGSGIEVSTGVVTDDRLRTSVPGVYAAGDIAEHPDPWSGEHRTVGNWQNAIFQGKIAGANMTGGDELFTTLTSYSISCFGLTIATVGAAEVSGGERVVRESADTVLQLVLKDDRVVGATCVGAFPDRAAIGKLITGRVALNPSMRAALADPRTPLASLVP